MKRLITTILLLAVMLTLSSCGQLTISFGNPAETTAPTGATVSPTQAVQAVTETPTAEPTTENTTPDTTENDEESGEYPGAIPAIEEIPGYYHLYSTNSSSVTDFEWNFAVKDGVLYCIYVGEESYNIPLSYDASTGVATTIENTYFVFREQNGKIKVWYLAETDGETIRLETLD